MEGVELASRILDQFSQKGDRQWPTLFHLLTGVDEINKPGFRSVSGSLEHDYPMAIEKKIIPQSIFSTEYKAPIPQELLELISQPDVKTCKMGIFPGIYRAWMSIESDIYIWDFRDGSDLSFYDGLKENILAIEMVPAKPNVFISSIKYLLCVTTPSQVVILGFKIKSEGQLNQYQRQILSIELLSRPIFALSTEGIIFNVIHGSQNGRIFLGANDGTIHEICYRAERGWVSDRCWKTNLSSGYLSFIFGTPLKFLTGQRPLDEISQICIDNTRKLLFTRSKSGALQAFDLGSDFSTFFSIGSFDFHSIIKEIMNVSRNTLESANIRKILSIHVIDYGELNLVAVTDSGYRIYFSCFNPPHIGLKMGINSEIRPTGLHLIHVRLPPGYCARSSLKKPSNAHFSFHTNGIFSIASHVGNDQDCLWLMSPFPYPSQIESEISTIHGLPGVTLDIQEIPTVATTVEEEVVVVDPWVSNLPFIVTQHLSWTKRIVVLCGNGTVVFKALKPFEILRDLISESMDREDILRGHFEMASTKDQPLANCLLLAIHPFLNGYQDIQEAAGKAFLHFGKLYSNFQQNPAASAAQQQTSIFPSPQQNPATPQGFTSQPTSPFDSSIAFNPSLVSTPAPSPQQQGQGRFNNLYGVSTPTNINNNWQTQQQQQQKNLYPQQQQQQQQSMELSSWPYSPRHDALYILVSRILVPFWNKPLIRYGIDENQTKIITPNIMGDEVSYAISFLQNIQNFITNNPSLYYTKQMENIMTPGGRQPMVCDMEKSSISGLKNFINLTLEVLGMWKILCDHQFQIILNGIDDRLTNTTMRELVITGHQTVTIIISALITKYLGDHAAVDSISLRLREVCPTLFKNEDAISSKVAEILTKLKTVAERPERESLLNESILLIEGIQAFGRVNFKSFCLQYAELGYPMGAVRVCIAAAKSADPENLAVSSLRINNINSLPPSVQNAFQIRSEIYKIVFEILNNFVSLSTTKLSPHLRKSQGEERVVIPAERARDLADLTIKGILSTDDEIFHVCLYNWLLERKLFDRLLEIKHPYLDAFLQRAGDAVVSGKWPTDGCSTNDTRVLDLLWRHHEMNQNHAAAAQILSKLADSTTTGLNLQQRIEYLSRAIISTKSCLRKGEYLETLEDKLEVAQIQKATLDAIDQKLKYISLSAGSEDEVKGYQDALHKLNSQLYNITTLYTDFSIPFKLHDVKLDILYSAGHSDKQMIDSLWADIIEAELKLSSRQPQPPMEGPGGSMNRKMETQMESIRRKLVSLGRKYIQSPVFFPVEWLVEHLEAMKPSEGVDPGWVFKTMLEVGVEFSDLLFVYESVWRKAVSRQGRGGNDLSIAKVIIIMIDMYVKRELALRSGYNYRKEIIGKCKSLTAIMIVEFSSRFDEDANSMKKLLNEINCRLERAV